MKRTIPDVDRIRGERLKALRVAAGLLQRQVGAAFDIDKAAVAAWEAGKTKPATERLGDLDRLYGGSGEVLALFAITQPGGLDELRGQVAVLRRALLALLEAAVRDGVQLPADVLADVQELRLAR